MISSGEILLEHLVAGFGNSLVDCIAQTLETVPHIGHRHDSRNALIIVFIRLIFQNIDVAVRFPVHDIRHDNRAHRGTEAGLQILKYTVETRAFIAQAVDEEHLRQTALCGGLVGLFSSDVHAGFAGNGNQHSIGGADCFAGGSFKVEQARRVEQVDLVVLPLQRRDRRSDGSLSADFLRIIIAHSVAISDFPEPVGRP